MCIVAGSYNSDGCICHKAECSSGSTFGYIDNDRTCGNRNVYYMSKMVSSGNYY